MLDGLAQARALPGMSSVVSSPGQGLPESPHKIVFGGLAGARRGTGMDGLHPGRAGKPAARLRGASDKQASSCRKASGARNIPKVPCFPGMSSEAWRGAMEAATATDPILGNPGAWKEHGVSAGREW